MLNSTSYGVDSPAMRGDIGDQLADRETIRLLRASGFGRVLDLIESDQVFTQNGKLSIQKLAIAAGVEKSRVAKLLEDARRMIDGEIPWGRRRW
jgi:hypothetical protein